MLAFSSPNYMVPENNGSVTVTVTASSPVLTDTVIRLTDVPTNGGARNGLFILLSDDHYFCSH